MPDPSTFAVFALAALGLLVIPGPSVTYIVTRSIHQGRVAGLVSVLGIHTGSVVHVVAAALGLSAVLVSSSVAFQVVKLAGAAYLIVLGVRTLLRREDGDEGDARVPHRLSRVYAQGVIVNVLNPKTALFFLAFLPQFVDAERGSVAIQMVVLGLVFIGLGLVSDSAYAFLAARLGGWLRSRPRFARRRRQFTGGMYIALGATAALSGHRQGAIV
jgi:threonine/homoserine/homoserine lactone efflux protein